MMMERGKMAGRSWRGGTWQDDDGEGEDGRKIMERGNMAG